MYIYKQKFLQGNVSKMLTIVIDGGWSCVRFFFFFFLFFYNDHIWLFWRRRLLFFKAEKPFLFITLREMNEAVCYPTHPETPYLTGY